jgi:hypothetical protein
MLSASAVANEVSIGGAVESTFFVIGQKKATRNSPKIKFKGRSIPSVQFSKILGGHVFFAGCDERQIPIGAAPFWYV